MANKAPEPTPTAVTPRAMEIMIELKQWICNRDEARVVPAAVVAHLTFAIRLDARRETGRFRLMSNKEVVAHLLTRLPEDVSLEQIAREIEFIAGVREGLDELDRGEGVGVAEVEKMIASWSTK
jgi:predicted transcriptional regulator